MLGRVLINVLEMEVRAFLEKIYRKKLYACWKGFFRICRMMCLLLKSTKVKDFVKGKSIVSFFGN